MAASPPLNAVMRPVPLLRAAARLALWTVIATGAIAFGFFFCTTPTRWYNVRATELIAWRNTLVLPYKFGNGTTGRTTQLLSGSLSFILIWQWCGTLAVALGAAGLMWLSASASTASSPSASGSSRDQAKATAARRGWSLGAAVNKSMRRVRRLLRCQVPPGGLWRWLLGPEGLSLLDLLLVALWFGLHLLWMHEMTMRVLDNRRTAPPPPKPRSPPPPGVKASSPAAASVNRTSGNSSLPSPGPSTAPAANATNSTARGIVRRLMQATSPPPARSNSSSNSSSNNTASSRNTTATAKAVAPPPPARKLKPLPEVVQDSVAKYAGWVGRLDILLLFFPLPRCNFLHWLLGADFPTLVKYHRWLGHGTLLVYSLHGVLYMGIWARDGVLTTMLDWGMDAGVNRLSGLISLCGGWLLWVTCAPWVRRRLFNLFYGCHILGAVVFMLFGFMHRKDVATWVMPGVFLYLLDVVLRTLQQNFNCVRMSATTDHPACAATARVAQGGGIMSLSIRCHESLRWVGSEVVFLNVPAISWWQWHPFTIASAPRPGPGGEEHLLELLIKRYDRWTQRLISRLASDDAPLTLYVSGPYCSGNRKWIQDFDMHVFVAGGIGVTPALGMIQELITARRQASDAAAPTGKVVLIWVSRTMDELRALPYEILEAAGYSSTNSGASKGAPFSSWLDLRLFLTSASSTSASARNTSDKADSKTSDVAAGIIDNLDVKQAPQSTIDSGSCNSSGSVAGAAAAAGLTPSFEALGGTLARPLSHPYMFSPLLWMAAVVLSFGGGFLGLICAQSYDAYMARNVAKRQDFSFVGMLQFAALGLGCTLPPAILMLAVQLYRRLAPQSPWAVYRPSKPTLSVVASSAANDPAVAAAAPTDVLPSAASSPSKLTVESYITYGRPDLPALLHQIATTGGLSGGDTVEPSHTTCCQSDSSADSAAALEELRVAVFASGLEPLVAGVANVCASVNGLWGRRGRAYLAFTATTHEL